MKKILLLSASLACFTVASYGTHGTLVEGDFGNTPPQTIPKNNINHPYSTKMENLRTINESDNPEDKTKSIGQASNKDDLFGGFDEFQGMLFGDGK